MILRDRVAAWLWSYICSGDGCACGQFASRLLLPHLLLIIKRVLPPRINTKKSKDMKNQLFKCQQFQPHQTLKFPQNPTRDTRAAAMVLVPLMPTPTASRPCYCPNLEWVVTAFLFRWVTLLLLLRVVDVWGAICCQQHRGRERVGQLQQNLGGF